jgi:hypothetical protein
MLCINLVLTEVLGLNEFDSCIIYISYPAKGYTSSKKLKLFENNIFSNGIIFRQILKKFLQTVL